MRARISSRIFLILTATISSGLSQIRVSPGVNLGSALTDTLVSSSSSSSSVGSTSFSRYNSVTKRLLIGPSLRLELPRGLGLEFDALYQRVDYDFATGSQLPGPFSSQSFEQGAANRWQFPLLVQYSPSMGKISPFVEAGPSISALVGGTSTFTSSTVSPPSATSTGAYTWSYPAITTAGFTAGGGVTVPAFGHHLRAEIRFSHWFSTAGNGRPTALERNGDFSATLGTVIGTGYLFVPVGPGGFAEHPNEASFLLGFFF